MMINIRRVAFEVFLLAFLVLGSWERSNAQDPETKPANTKPEMLTCKVLVVDPDGNPVEDALVDGVAMRARGNAERASYWVWDSERHGPAQKLKTNENGVVEMPYPKYIIDRLETGEMTWRVEHPDFVATLERDRNVDDDPIEIRLARGFRIAVTAIDGNSGERINNDLYAVIGGTIQEWKLSRSGMLVSPVFTPANSTMRIVQLADGKPAMFSRTIVVEPGTRSRILLNNVKLLTGTRVEGKIDDSIPRPIKNGLVAAMVICRKGIQKKMQCWSWYDTVPVNEDGTFVFESLPDDEIVQMIPVCDGWFASKPEKDSVLRFLPWDVPFLEANPTIPQIPQLALLSGAKVDVTLKMKKTTSIRIIVTSPRGAPVQGAQVVATPGMIWFGIREQVVGLGSSSRAFLVNGVGGESALSDLARFSSVTDENGMVVIGNLPVNGRVPFTVIHPDFNFQWKMIEILPDGATTLKVKVQEKEMGNSGSDEEVTACIHFTL